MRREPPGSQRPPDGALAPTPAFDSPVSYGTGAVPIHFFDVIIHFRGQAVPAFCSPVFQDLAPTTGLHTPAEAVNARPAADFGLVGTFWHVIFSIKKQGLAPC